MPSESAAVPTPGEVGPPRTLRFTLTIETELGECDEAKPAIAYVADWLNDNGYGYVQIGDWEEWPHD